MMWYILSSNIPAMLHSDPDYSPVFEVHEFWGDCFSALYWAGPDGAN